MKALNKSVLLGVSAVALAITLPVSQVRGAITVDGSLDGDYGSALATNVNPTGFGDSNFTGTPNGPDANGSETDGAYGVIQGSTLYVMLTGNSENNGNHWNVFISTGAAGQSTLALPATGTMQAMNGSKFSPGFQAVFALDVNDFQGTFYTEEYTLTGTPSGGYVGSVGMTAGIGAGVPNAGAVSTIGLNNSNTGGVTGSSGSAAASLAVTTGLELAIPLSALGNPTGPIEVLADINGGNDGYLSNQFLPGLAPGTGNLGPATTFDFSGTPGEFFTVVPEPSTIGLVVVGLLGALSLRRRKA